MIQKIVADLQSVAEDSLRIVASIDSLDYEIEYIRDDLEGGLSDDQFNKIYQSIVVEGLAGRDIGTVAGVGNQEAQIVLYEDVVLFIFPTEKYESVMVSTDRDGSTPIADVVETASSALSDAD